MLLLTDLVIHPVKSFAPVPLTTAAVEPWGLAGDRRWMLVDAEGTMVSQREDPRLGQIGAQLRHGLDLRVSAADRPDLFPADPERTHLDVSAPSGTLVPVSVFGVPFKAVDAGPEAAAWFSRLLGADLRLVHLDDPGHRPMPVPTSLADAYPLLLTTPESLAALNELIAGEHPDDPVKGQALPMGRFRPNVVVSGAEAWAETGWRRLRIGGTEFRVEQQCGRCVITTLDPATGERRGPEPLLSLARHRRFGKSLAFGMHLTPVGELGSLQVSDRVTVLEQGPLPVPR
ncbi:MOSC domain-containing protein [Streptacidiphilus sp. EB129]|uniref:MOSC domain-containing protein n=1 Tax=Streptacidiphilus sp. EB129 TaxID=3156262 RepID=UPI003513501E